MIRDGRRRGFWKCFFVVGFLGLGVVLFHQPLLIFGCRVALSWALPEGEGRVVSYGKLHWEQGAIVIPGLSVKEGASEWSVDRIECKLSGGVFPLCFTPEVRVVHPHILASSAGVGQVPILPCFYHTRFFQPRWKIEGGVLELAPSVRFYFSMDPLVQREGIGTFKCSHDPHLLGAPVLSAEVRMGDAGLQVGFQLREEDMGRLLPLATFVPSGVRGYLERACGGVELEGVIALGEEGQVEELHVRGGGQGIACGGAEGGLRCDEITGSLSFPKEGLRDSFWDQISLHLLIQNAECSLKRGAFGVKELSGQMEMGAQEGSHCTLSGKLLQGQAELAFSLSGKGGIQENVTLWSEWDLIAEAPRGAKMRSVFSLCRGEEDAFTIHVKVEDAAFEHVEWMRALCGLPGECVEGVCSGEATALYQGGSCQTLCVEQCLLEKMRWYFPEKHVVVFAEGIAGSCALGRGRDGEWKVEDVHCEVKGGDYVDQRFRLDLLSGGIALEQGVLQASSLKGQWGSLGAEVEILGSRGDHFADVKIQGGLDAWLEGDALPISAQIAVKAERTEMVLEAEGEIGGDGFRGFASFFTALPSWPDVLTHPFPTFTWNEGRVFAGCVHEESYAALVSVLLPGCTLKGDVQCDVAFSPAHIAMEIAGDHVHFSHPLGAVHMSTMQGRRAHLSYAFSSREWRAEIPFYASEISFKNRPFALTHVDGGMIIEGGAVDWRLRGDFEHILCPVNAATSIKEGRCHVAFDSQERHFRVEGAEGIWELIDGMPLQVQLSSDFSEKGVLDFSLKVIDGKKEFIRCEGKAKASSSSEWEIALDDGVTHFGGTQLHVTECTVDNQLGILSLEMNPTLLCQNVCGYAALLQNGGFLPLNASLNHLQELCLGGEVQVRLSKHEQGLSLRAHSNTFTVKGVPCTPLRVDGQKREEGWQIERLEAGPLSLKGVFLSNAEGFVLPQFEGSWKGVALKGKGHVLTDQKRFFCRLDSLKGDLTHLFSTLPQGTFVAAAVFTGDYSHVEDPLQVEGEANLCADLTAPLRATLRNKRAVKFTYGMKKGLCCREVDFCLIHPSSRVELATVGADMVHYADSSGALVEQMRFSLERAMLSHSIDAHLLPPLLAKLEWKGALEGNGELRLTEDGSSFLGSVQPGDYGFDGKYVHCEQLQLRLTRDMVNLRAKALVEGNPLWGSLQLSLAKTSQGMLKLLDHPKAEGMKIVFSTQQGKVALESIQGCCYGLSCSLARSTTRAVSSATVLTGEVALDANLLSPLLPKEVREGINHVQLGSGYRWRGDLVLGQGAQKGFLLQGSLLGKECELLGYRFQSLEGTIEASPAQVIFSQMKIQDGAGAIAMKRMELKKGESWRLHIPEVLIQRLRPSLMRRVDLTPFESKPFAIEKGVLKEIHGKLGEMASLEGSGSLSFVNQFKKEASIWDVPLDMVKKLGLDVGLLTPVQGEVHMELRGDKFYLVALDNSFSEGGRAEFYLPMEKSLSYIDLQGRVHIDLKMRQDVVLKVTQPLTLTIRGTLDKLRYGLHF